MVGTLVEAYSATRVSAFMQWAASPHDGHFGLLLTEAAAAKLDEILGEPGQHQGTK
jgi:hypothetical protein